MPGVCSVRLGMRGTGGCAWRVAVWVEGAWRPGPCGGLGACACVLPASNLSVCVCRCRGLRYRELAANERDDF